MIIKFIKDGTSRDWYLKDKTWRGEKDDLKVPSSIAQLIEEECSLAATEVSFLIDTHLLENSKNILKLEEKSDHAVYDTMYGTIKLCDIALLLFPMGYPEIVYYKIISNE